MGSSGGGGGSGRVDYPDYMKDWHTEFLGDIVSIGADLSLTEAMNAAMSGVSPYSSFVGVNVNDSFLGTGKVITDFGSPFTYLTTYAGIDFDTALEGYRNADKSGVGVFLDGSIEKITDLVNAESAVLDADLDLLVLPKFRAGFRNANAVLGSAFVIGEAIIRAQKSRDLTKSAAILNAEAYKINADLALRNEQIILDFATKKILSKRDIAATAMDFAKIYTVARTETDDANIEMAAKDRLWDLKVFQYGGNFLGSISGSAVSTDSGKGSKVASVASATIAGGVMGGMMAGAQAGGLTGPQGAVIGAVVGAAYGLLTA